MLVHLEVKDVLYRGTIDHRLLETRGGRLKNVLLHSSCTSKVKLGQSLSVRQQIPFPESGFEKFLNALQVDRLAIQSICRNIFHVLHGVRLYDLASRVNNFL